MVRRSPVAGILGQLRRRSAPQQGVREGDVGARGDVEGDDLEGGPLSLPGEDGRQTGDVPATTTA